MLYLIEILYVLLFPCNKSELFLSYIHKDSGHERKLKNGTLKKYTYSKKELYKIEEV